MKAIKKLLEKIYDFFTKLIYGNQKEGWKP